MCSYTMFGDGSDSGTISTDTSEAGANPLGYKSTLVPATELLDRKSVLFRKCMEYSFQAWKVLVFRVVHEKIFRCCGIR